MKLRIFMKGYWRKTFIGAFFKFVEAAFELFLPFLMAYIIEEGIKKGNHTLLIQMTVMMLILVVLGYFSSLTCQYLAAVVEHHFAYRLREALMKKINQFSFSKLDEFSSSTLTNRLMSDVNQIQIGVGMTIRLAIRAPFLMIGSYVMIYIMNQDLAKILAFFIPIFIVVILSIMYASMLIFRKVQVQLDKMTRVVQDYLYGIRIIRSFAKDEHEMHRFQKKNDTMHRLLVRMGALNSLSNPLTTILMNIALVLIVYKGALIAPMGGVSQGELIAIINYCSQMLLAFLVFINLVLVYARAFSARRRVLEVLESELDFKESENAVDMPKEITSITLSHVDFYYPNQRSKTLENINLKIKSKQTIGVVGLTGSGKSTLLRLLARFYDVSDGSIYINDENIANYKLQQLRETIGFVSQKSSLLSGSIRDNLVMGKTYQEEDIKRSLEVSQAAMFVDEKGLDSYVYPQGSNFSGGQKQRLHIARALVKKPKILILDDVFSALDFNTDKELRSALRSSQENTICVIASQRISSVVQADKIVVMDKGSILAQGKHNELLESCELYKKMYESQTKKVAYV